MDDVSQYPHLTRSGPRGILKFRLRVPADARAVLGCREIVKSLKTADLKAALPSYHALLRESDERIAAARSGEVAPTLPTGAISPQTPAAKPSLPPAFLQDLYRRHYDAVWRQEQEQQAAKTNQSLAASTGHAPTADWVANQLRQARARFTGEVTTPFSGTREGSLAHEYVNRLYQRGGELKAMLAISNTEALRMRYTRLCPAGFDIDVARVLAEAEIAALNALQAAAMFGSRVTAPVPPGTDPTPSRTPKSGGGEMMSTATKKWVAANARAWSDERRELCEVVLTDFIKICGDKPVRDYTAQDGGTFEEVYSALPANISKLTKKTGAAAVEARDLLQIKEAAKQLNLEPQSPATMNKKLGIVMQAFKWMKPRFGPLTNPVEGIKVVDPVAKRNKKIPFSIPNLCALFNMPVFTGAEVSSKRRGGWLRPGTHSMRDTDVFWLPILGLFTGARLDELCTLHGADMREHEGIPFFAFWESATDEQGVAYERRLKTNASTSNSSIRSTPVHPMLIQMGFVDFARKCGARKLFPDIPMHRSGRYSDAAGKRFRSLRKLAGITDPRVDFHSFRDTFLDAAQQCGVPFDDRERFVGHALPGLGGHYGASYEQEARNMKLMKRRAGEMAKLEFEGLDLLHLVIKG